MTFKETRAKHLEDLGAMGWTVALRDRNYRELKVPYATSPGGQWRLWFKAQAVYFLHGPPFDFGNARSLVEDMRQPTAQLLRILERAAIWEQKNYPEEFEGREVERVSLVVSGAFAGPEDEFHRNAGSGYTHCPCCGYDTVSNDEDEPELCSDCEEAGCAEDGSEPMCDLREEDMSTNARRQRQSSRCDWQTGYGLPHTEQCTKRAIPGSPYCREHSKDFKERYPGQAYPKERFHKNSSEEYWVWAVDKARRRSRTARRRLSKRSPRMKGSASAKIVIRVAANTISTIMLVMLKPPEKSTPSCSMAGVPRFRS